MPNKGQYTQPTQKPVSSGSLRMLPPKKQVSIKTDIRQSDNYQNSVANANKYKQESDYANSLKGMAKNFGKAVADTVIQTPFKFGASINEIPGIIAKGGQTTQREYNVPGLNPFKSYQSDFQNVANDVIDNKKGLGSAAWSMAQPVIAGVEMLGMGKGLQKGVTAFKSAPTLLQGLRKSAPEVLDAFLPTTRGVQKGTQTPLPETLSTGTRRTLQTNVPVSTQLSSKVSSYTPNTSASANSVKSVISYIDNNGNKVYTELTPSELAVLRNEVKNIPAATKGYSQIHLDAKTPTLSEVGKNVSSEEFISGHPQASEVLNTAINKGKRGIIDTISNSPEYSTNMARNLEDVGGYEVRHQMPLVKEAQRTIAKNMQEAEHIATTELSDRATVMSDELLKHYDSIAIKAKNVGDTATFEQAMSKARALALQTDVNLRESGRAISAANRFNKQSPEGMLRTINDIAQSKGEKLNLSHEQVFDFQRKAQELTQILDPKQRALKTFELIDEVADSIPSGAKDKFYEVLNLPRAMMATADLSAPLRQGIFTMARNPKMFAKNFGSMFKYAFSDNAYKNLKADIVTSPNYSLYIKHKLPLTDLASGLDGKEERFMTQLADKIPIFGHISKGSQRAYTGFLNKMRVDLFDDFVNTAKLNNITDPKFFEDAAKFVGSATGRGQLGRFEDSAKLLNSVFFSPRLMASRMNLLNPVYYAKLHPTVRKEALKSLGSFVGTGMSVLGLAKLNGAEVGDDPRSADFGKIKIGNTRMDIWGGFQQYARLIGQLTTGEKVSTITGKQSTLGEGYGTPTRSSIVADFFKSKENPIASFVTKILEGKQFGQEPNIPVEIIDRFIPMIVQDAFDLYKDKGLGGLGYAIPGAFGVGSQTYGEQIPTLSQTPSGAPSIQWQQEPGLGETIYNKVIGKKVSNIPEEYRKPLTEEKRKETLRQIDVSSAKARVLETGKSEQVGDTFVYIQDGIVKTKKIGKEIRTPIKDKIIYEEIAKRKNKPFYVP